MTDYLSNEALDAMTFGHVSGSELDRLIAQARLATTTRIETLDEISTLITQARTATDDPATALHAVQVAVLRLRNAARTRHAVQTAEKIVREGWRLLLPLPYRLGEQMNYLPVQAPVLFLCPFDQSSVNIHRDAQQKTDQFSHVGSVNHSTPQYLSDIIMISLLRVNDMAVVLTRNNIKVLVDDEDIELVEQFSWYAFHVHGKNLWYALSHFDNPETGKKSQVRMHRLILKPSMGMLVDHVNGDGLDNRRSNLRVASYGQNARNRHSFPNNTSGYRGVTFNRAKRKWDAFISIDGRNHRVGRSKDVEVAARLYDTAAREHYGDFATFNFPREDERGATIPRPGASQ